MDTDIITISSRQETEVILPSSIESADQGCHVAGEDVKIDDEAVLHQCEARLTIDR